MKFIHQTCAVIILAVVGGACTVTLDSQSQIAREERRFTVSGTPSIHLTTFDGAIEIQSWDRPDVLVEIEKRGPTKEALDRLTIKSSQDGNTIQLEVAKPERQ